MKLKQLIAALIELEEENGDDEVMMEDDTGRKSSIGHVHVIVDGSTETVVIEQP
jgi:hypothetical protein